MSLGHLIRSAAALTSEAGPSRLCNVSRPSYLPSLIHLKPAATTYAPNNLQRPHFHTIQQRGFSLSAVARANTFQDEDIVATKVLLINYETGELSKDPVSPREILARIDRNRFILRQVADARDGLPPVCKLMSKKDLFARAKSQSKAKTKSQTAVQKRISITWLVTPNDLSHKIKQARKALAKGGKGSTVEVDIVTRKGRGFASGTREDKMKLIDSIDRQMQGSEDGEEGGNLEGSPGSVNFRRKGNVDWRQEDSRAVVFYEVYE